MSTQNIPFSILKKKKSPLIILNLQRWDFSKRLKNEFEIAMVNEPSVFGSLKFYCISVNKRHCCAKQGCRQIRLLSWLYLHE